MVNESQNYTFEPVYVLHGNENFLINNYVSNLIKYFKEGNNIEQNIKTFDCTTTSIKDIFSYASLCSLIGKQMIVVKNIQNCKELTNKKTIEFIEKYSKNPNPQNILVLCSDKLLLATNLFLKLFSRYKVERFNKMNDSEVINFIKQYFSNITITDEAIDLLRLFSGDDLQILTQEMNKLTEYNHFDKIDSNIISEYISFQRSYNPFEFLNAIVQKNITLLEKILNNNDNIEGILIIALLYSFFSKIMMMHTDKAANDTFYQKYYQDGMKMYSLTKIEHIMHCLLEADLQLKGITTTYINDKEILRDLIFNIII